MKNIDFKKILLIVLFIPTYIAIANYNSQKPDDVIASVTTVTIADPEGRTTTVTSDNDTTGVITLFNNINKSGTPMSNLPESLAGSEFLLVTYKTAESEVSYKYYFTIDSSDCYQEQDWDDDFEDAVQKTPAVREVDADDDLRLVFHLFQKLDLGVLVESRKHSHGVLVVDQLAAELQVESLAVFVVDPLKDVLGLFLKIFFCIKTDLSHNHLLISAVPVRAAPA